MLPLSNNTKVTNEKKNNTTQNDLIKGRLKSVLLEAINIDQYSYYIGTKNFKANQTRFKDNRKEFPTEDINKLLKNVKFGDSFEVYRILEKSPKLVNWWDAIGKTPLHWAVIREQEETVDVLLNFNPNLEFKDLFRKTAMDYARALPDFTLALNIKNYAKGYYIPDIEKHRQELFYQNIKKTQRN